jgi:NADPH-dependent curcumin reductase CurA
MRMADLTGEVVQVGPSVTGFQPGDRIIGFAHGLASQNLDNCAFQTYTVVRANAAAVLPASLTFAQGATLPTAVGTAVMTLIDVLGLSLPGWKDPSLKVVEPKAVGILVWGGASSGVGSMTVQLARMAGFQHVFATASAHQHERVRSLGATAVVDYHSPTAVDELVAAAESAGVRIVYALDAICLADTVPAVVEVLRRSSHADDKKIMSYTTRWPESVPQADDIETRQVLGDELWTRRLDLCEWLYAEALPQWLAEDKIVLSPHRVVGQGVSAVQGGLNELQKGVSGEKLIVEI